MFGLITHGKNSQNEAASFFTKVTINLFRSHSNKQQDNQPITIEITESVIKFGREVFQWKQKSFFKRGRAEIQISNGKPEVDIHFGEKIRLKVIRHTRERKVIDRSKFSFLGIYVLSGTHLTNSSHGFLGSKFNFLRAFNVDGPGT